MDVNKKTIFILLFITIAVLGVVLLLNQGEIFSNNLDKIEQDGLTKFTGEKDTSKKGDIIIGTPGVNNVDPVMRLPYYDGLLEFAIWYEGDTYTARDLSISIPSPGDNSITWTGTNSDVKFDYTGDDYSYDLIFASNPGQESFAFDISYDKLIFYYQDRLDNEYNDFNNCNATACWNKKGEITTSREEKIIGSYAVYDTKGRKVFHLYRPLLIENDGTTTWGTLNIDPINQRLIVTTPKGYFTNANYPVKVDPTFGFNGNPATATNVVTGHSLMSYSEPNIFTATENVTITSFSWYGHNQWSGTDTVQIAVYNMTTFTNPEERAHPVENITVSSSTTQWWDETGLSISLVEGQDYAIGFGTDDTVRMYYDRTSDHEEIGEVMPQTWNATPTYTNDFTFGLKFNYTEGPACSNGLCNFGPGYLLEDLELRTGFATPPISTAGQMKWNITDFCDTGETLTNAYLQLYIYQKADSPDNDVSIDYIRDQTWDESSSAATIDGQTLYNGTTRTLSSTTGSTFTNISITTQLQEACNRDEYLSIRFDDPDNALGTINNVDDGTSITIGDDNLFSPPDSLYRFRTKEYTTDITQRPRIFAEWDATEPTLNKFVDPTIISGITTHDWLYFNMSLNETAGTGGDALLVEIDGTNYTQCSGCPPSPPDYRQYNRTGLSDGNHTFALWINGNRYDENWAVTETGSGVEVNLVSPEDGFFDETASTTEINVSCNATAPSGIVNITLEGDFGRRKWDFATLQTYTPTGNPSFDQANFTVSGIAINDTYNWNCKVNTIANNTAQANNNWSVKIGKGKVYVVRAVDTETYNRESQDDKFYMNLSLESYNIVDSNNLSNASNGLTARIFDSNWRGNYNDTSGNWSKYTWYMMTHEAHGWAENTQGKVETPIGYNIIADIMTGNGTVFYDYNGTYLQAMEDFGDNIAWHNHHVYWNGTSDSDPNGYWVGLENDEFFFNGTELFHTNTTNETDFVRAEKLVAQFAYENALDWTSFRAGWLQTGTGEHRTNYLNFLGNNTALDYTPTPALSGNMWEEIRFENENNNLIGFRCASGAGTQAQVNNAFEYAKNGSRIVTCFYSHNYAGDTLKFDTETVHGYLDNSYGTYGVDWEWATDLEAAQAYYRVTDFTKPTLTLSSDANFLYVESNEELYMAPAITIFRDDGITTNYSLHYPEENGTLKWKFNYSGISMVGFRARGTDKSFNVATALAEVNLDIIDPTTSSPDTITNESRNITFQFRMYNGGTEITSGVTINTMTVGGLSCTALGGLTYTAGAWQQQCNTSTSLSNDNYYDLFVSADHASTPTLGETEIDAVFLAPADSCTYSGSGDWNIDCSDMCYINTAYNLGGNSIYLYGAGQHIFSKMPYNFDYMAIQNSCKLGRIV